MREVSGIPTARGRVGEARISRSSNAVFQLVLGSQIARGSVRAAKASPGSPFAPRTVRAVSTATLDQIIHEASASEKVEESLVRAVVEAESGFRPEAVSRAGAMGLMQLMPGTARSLGVKDPFDPAANVAGGAGYLRAMLDRFGSVPLALAAYNAGPAAVERYGGVPPYAETRSYVDVVTRILNRNKIARGALTEGSGDDDKSTA